jgi:hypothetical protein
MDPIRDFDLEGEWLLDACLERISRYPAALRPPAQTRLEAHCSLRHKSPYAFHIGYLLPFWLEEPFALDRDVCRQVALSNIFGVLYFLLQDGLLDAGPGGDLEHLQPLGTFFFLDLVAPYRSLFEPDSPFWALQEEYVAQWGRSVLWEQQRHWGQVRAFEQEDLLLLARKAAVLKIPCAALCLLAGREEAIGTLEKMVDDLMVSYQFMDDLKDWRGDLAQGNYTYFLTRVMARRGPGPAAPLTGTDVEKALFVGLVLDEYLDLVAEYNRRALESASALEAPYLTAYLTRFDQGCGQLGEELEARRSARIREQFADLMQEAPVRHG